MITSTDSTRTTGVIFGFLGMLGFSGTLVATRVAVADFTPLDIALARIVIAALLGAAFLMLSKQFTRPHRKNLMSLLVMGLGLAVGYPFFLAMALKTVPAVHGAVVTGLAPAATAIIREIVAPRAPSSSRAWGLSHRDEQFFLPGA